MSATPIVPAFSLKAWRTSQLAQVKRTLAYQTLAPIQRRIVDHIIRRYLSPHDGAFPKQATLAQRFGVCRETINRHMREILLAGIFTASPRYRGAGTHGGRTSNRLFINPDLLSDATTTEGVDVTQPVTQPLTQPVTAEGSNQIEGSSHVEALPSLETEEQVEGRSQVEGAREGASESEAAAALGAVPTEIETQHHIATNDPVATRELASAPLRTGAELLEDHYEGDEPVGDPERSTFWSDENWAAELAKIAELYGPSIEPSDDDEKPLGDELSTYELLVSDEPTTREREFVGAL